MSSSTSILWHWINCQNNSRVHISRHVATASQHQLQLWQCIIKDSNLRCQWHLARGSTVWFCRGCRRADVSVEPPLSWLCWHCLQEHPAQTSNTVTATVTLIQEKINNKHVTYKSSLETSAEDSWSHATLHNKVVIDNQPDPPVWELSTCPANHLLLWHWGWANAATH